MISAFGPVATSLGTIGLMNQHVVAMAEKTVFSARVFFATPDVDLAPLGRAHAPLAESALCSHVRCTSAS